MKNTLYLLTFIGLNSSILGAVNFSTNFDASEGYTNGKISNSSNFNESVAAGFYIPGGTAPDYGVVKRSPTSNGATAYYTTGAGADFSAGASWTVSLDYTFEGVESSPTGSTAINHSLGFSGSSSSNSNLMFAGIQKGAAQDGNYQLFINGGGFSQKSFSFADIGDDTTDADDLTDNIRLEFSLTKSAVANEFNAVATLYNIDSASTVATTSTTLIRSGVYSADLFGYFKGSGGNEDNNYDMINIDTFAYATVPENSKIALLLGSFTALLIILRQRRS